jgi:putative membrane protein
LAHHGGYGWWPALLILLGGAAEAYVWTACRARGTAAGWSGFRVIAWLTGIALVAVATSPDLSGWVHHDDRGQLVQHLIVGMYAPLALVLAAPMTLALRSVPRPHAKRITGVLRHPSGRLIGHPVTALVLSTGGLYLVHLTAISPAAHTEPLLHTAVVFHYFAAGYLFAWSIAGPDPAPHRPQLPTRVAVLVIAGAGHAVLAKLLYTRAPLGPAGDAARAGAQLLYYGADGAELLLAAALFAGWYHRQRPARHRPRAESLDADWPRRATGWPRRATRPGTSLLSGDR